jgi:hypothetical protein
MKSLLILLTVFTTLFATPSFARDEKVSPSVLKSFQSSFASATDVAWSQTVNGFRAQFMLNAQHISAFYDSEGELLAMTRNVTSLQLPMLLQAELKKEYGEFWISNLFEVANDIGITYYATVEKADAKIVLKSDSFSGWMVYQKQRKS